MQRQGQQMDAISFVVQSHTWGFSGAEATGCKVERLADCQLGHVQVYLVDVRSSAPHLKRQAEKKRKVTDWDKRNKVDSINPGLHLTPGPWGPPLRGHRTPPLAWNLSNSSPLYVMEPLIRSPSSPFATLPASTLSSVVLPEEGGPSRSVKRP